MTTLGGAAHKLCNLPCLGSAMADVRVVGLSFVRSVQMGAKDLDDVFLAGTDAYPGLSYTLAYIPVTTKEGGRTAIERIPVHGTLFDWPFGEDCQAAAEDATPVELCIGEYVFCLFADIKIVLLGPAFLKAYNLGSRRGLCELISNFRETFMAVLGDELETQAVVRDEP